MANPMRGEAEAKLSDGRTLTLCFNANAWVEIEEVLGKPTPAIVDELRDGGASMKTQRAIIWGALRKHHPEMTLEDAGEALVEASEAMARGLGASLPKGEAEPDEGDEEAGADAVAGPPTNGAGTNS